jgi:alcohol dehydrogenase (cytochrome c)
MLKRGSSMRILPVASRPRFSSGPPGCVHRLSRGGLFIGLALAGSLGGLTLAASLGNQVSFERLLRASDEPQNWLTYSGTFRSQRHSLLTQIAPENARNLELQWVFQARSLEKFEATPLVVDGVMYTVSPPNNVVALDAATGTVFWVYRHHPSPEVHNCCGNNNRGLAILGNTLFMGTIDARLIAIDATTGERKWETQVERSEAGYSIMHAPLVVKDKVIVGTGGGEFGIRGFIAAYDAKTGVQVWRFNTIPGPGEPGHETWRGDPDAWKHGGGPVWVTGSYDPDFNLTYWGIGNPGPDWNGDNRDGDNLYSESVVALDADTGKLTWHYQFTPHDELDYDAVQVPVLADLQWPGPDGRAQPRKVMMWANRNGFFYVLDRVTGQFLLGKPFVKVNWASGFDEKARPIRVPGKAPSLEGTVIYPGVQGGTNWYSPSYSPSTGLFYVSSWDDYSTVYVKGHSEYREGRGYPGGNPWPAAPDLWGGLVENHFRSEMGYGAIRALDPLTGERKWEFKMPSVTESGLLTTASDVLFGGGREGYFMAIDARTGALLWKATVGGVVISGPMSYTVSGRQYVAVAAGSALFSFALRR